VTPAEIDALERRFARAWRRRLVAVVRQWRQERERAGAEPEVVRAELRAQLPGILADYRRRCGSIRGLIVAAQFAPLTLERFD